MRDNTPFQNLRNGVSIALIYSVCLTIASSYFAHGASAAGDDLVSTGTVMPARLHPWFLRLDVAGILPSVNGRTTIADLRVPGNTVAVNDSVTVSFDLGYFITENIAIAGVVGLPPRATLRGEGALASIGVAATARYGPAALLLQYHPPPLLGARPYFGVGVNYTIFTNVKGIALQEPRLANAFGVAFQAGVDLPISARWSLNVDAVKILVSTRAYGSYQGLPVTSRITVNPLIVRAGVTWRF
jgi:outer membrane protein